MLVAPLSGDPGIGLHIARALGAEILGILTRDHPDGELYLRIDGNVEEEHVILVQSMYPSQDRKFVETLLAVDALKRHGASRVDLVAGYLAYARQDKIFLQGEPVSVDALLRSLISAGVERIYAVEPHSRAPEASLGSRFLSIDGVAPLAEAFREDRVDLVVSPDAGGIERAQRLSKIVKAGIQHMVKTRDRHTGEIQMRLASDIDLRGASVILVDDIISTGGTIAAATRILRSAGAEKIYVACVHPLFVGDSHTRIKESGASRIVCCRTVKTRAEGVEYLDPGPHVAGVLARLV